MKNDDTIKFEAGTSGMMQMAEMWAPGTKVYQALQTKCNGVIDAMRVSEQAHATEKKQMLDRIDGLEETVEQLRVQIDDCRAETEYYRDMYNQQVGASKALLFVLVSMPKVKEFTQNSSRDDGMKLRSMLLDIVENPTPNVITAIIQATQLPKSSAKALDDATEAMKNAAAEPRVKIDNLNGTATGTVTQTINENPPQTLPANPYNQLDSPTPKA